jgi:hypothetical protein
LTLGGTARIRRNPAQVGRRSSIALVQPIAHTRLADDQQRTRRINFDLLPKLAHQNTQVLNITCVIAPNFPYQLLMRHHESYVSGETFDQGIFFSC